MGLEISTLQLLLNGAKKGVAMPRVASVTSGDQENLEDDEKSAEAGGASDDVEEVPEPQYKEDKHRTTGELGSVVHQAVHTPAVSHDGCEDCMVGSRREAPYVADRSTREVPERLSLIHI